MRLSTADPVPSSAPRRPAPRGTRMLHAGPPTVELLRPVGPDVPSDERVFQVLDLCLQVGEVLLSSGEAAADTSATMSRLAGACGLDPSRSTSPSPRSRCAAGGESRRAGDLDAARPLPDDRPHPADAGHRLVDQVVGGDIDVPQPTPPWPRRSVAPSVPPLGGHRRLGRAGGGGGLLLGGGPVVMLTAFVVTALIDRIGRQLSRLGRPAVLRADRRRLRRDGLHPRAAGPRRDARSPTRRW